MKQIITLGLSLVLTASAIAAPAPQNASPARSTKKRTAAASPVTKRLDEMQQAIDAQQQQIQQLMQEVKSRDAVIQQLQQQNTDAQNAATQAEQKASAAATQADQQQQEVTSVRKDVTDLKSSVTNTAVTLQETQKETHEGLSKLSDLAHGKIKLGATFYGDWSLYSASGFGPQWYDNVNQPGPGNAGFNTFEATRTYINFFYTPTDAVTLRITPDIYRQVDGTSGAIPYGNGAQIGSSENGNLTFRLKYAYVDFNTLFAGSKSFKKVKLTFGQTQNPLIDWEEGLSGYRFAYLMPWNYLSLSSTYAGAKLHGPIEVNGKEYLDFDLGVFTTASFHSIETNDKKQAMGRLTFYPFGTKTDRTGFGVTVFDDYGYNTKFPYQVSTPVNRFAVLAFYQSADKGYQIAGEYDFGRNAFSTGNMFSGVAPVAGGPYDAFNTLAGSILAGNRTRQQGFAFFGHARLGHSPFSLWGLYHNFQPNTQYSGDNPLDFSRTVGGISYQVTKHFDFAVGDENLHYLHPQGLVPGGDTNAVAIFTQFNY